MSTNTPLVGVYPVQGTIGNVGTPGAPVVHFALLVFSGKHFSLGHIELSPATPNGNYSGDVRGEILSTDNSEYIMQVILRGTIHQDG